MALENLEVECCGWSDEYLEDRIMHLACWGRNDNPQDIEDQFTLMNEVARRERIEGQIDAINLTH